MVSENMMMSIDKVGIRYNYSGQGKQNEYYQLLELRASLKKGFVGVGAQVWPVGKHSMTNMKIPLDSGTSLFIRFGYCHQQHWAWLYFNPSKMSKEAFAEVKGYFVMLYESDTKSLLEHGQLSQLDIALDVQAKLNNYMYVDNGLRTDHMEKESEGTIYLGRKGGSRNFAIYDKRKEQKDVLGIDSEHPWLRIEARLVEAEKNRFGKMLEVENPFLHLCVVDRKALEEDTSPLIKKFRSGLIAGHSPTRLLSNYFSAAEKQKLWGRFGEISPPWWDGKEIWTQYPDSLQWVHEL